MHWRFVWQLVALVGAALGIGGLAYAHDQRQKRVCEQESARSRLLDLERKLHATQQRHATLLAALGASDERVNVLAREVERLSREVAMVRSCA